MSTPVGNGPFKFHSRGAAFILPLHGGAPSLIIIFSLGLALAERAGLFGLALALVLTSWFWKYAFILFDHVTRGSFEPPALDIQMVNPVDEQRPLALLCILGAIYFICHVLGNRFGQGAALAAESVVIPCLPAIVAVLALERNVLAALNPVEWFRLIAGLRWRYLLILGATLVYAGLMMLTWRSNLWRVAQLAVSLFLCLSWFTTWAGLLYDRRDDVGLEVWYSPEQTRAKELALDLKKTSALFDEAYALARSDRHTEAWRLISGWLESRGYQAADFEWADGRMATWEDNRYWKRLNQEHLERLLAANTTGLALRVVEHALRRDASFRPDTSAATLWLAQVAATGGAPNVARMLLSDFDARFSSDPNVRAAHVLAERLGA